MVPEPLARINEVLMNSEMPESVSSKQLMEEAEQTLRAIQHGTVDAFVVEEPVVIGFIRWRVPTSTAPWLRECNRAPLCWTLAGVSFTAISAWHGY